MHLKHPSVVHGFVVMALLVDDEVDLVSVASTALEISSDDDDNIDDRIQQIEPWLDGTLRDDFMEIFCPPRIVPILKQKGFRAFLSIDISSGDQLDLSLSGDRGTCLFEMRRRRPRVLLTSSPCRWFSKLMMMFNKKRLAKLGSTRSSEKRLFYSISACIVQFFKLVKIQLHYMNIQLGHRAGSYHELKNSWN